VPGQKVKIPSLMQSGVSPGPQQAASIYDDCIYVFTLPVDSPLPLTIYSRPFLNAIFAATQKFDQSFSLPVLLEHQYWITFRDPSNSFVVCLRKLFAIGFLEPRPLAEVAYCLQVILMKGSSCRNLLPSSASAVSFTLSKIAPLYETIDIESASDHKLVLNLAATCYQQFYQTARTAHHRFTEFFLASIFAFHHNQPPSPDSCALLELLPLLLLQTLPSFDSHDYEFQPVLDWLLSGLTSQSSMKAKIRFMSLLGFVVGGNRKYSRSLFVRSHFDTITSFIAGVLKTATMTNLEAIPFTLGNPIEVGELDADQIILATTFATPIQPLAPAERGCAKSEFSAPAPLSLNQELSSLLMAVKLVCNSNESEPNGLTHITFMNRVLALLDNPSPAAIAFMLSWVNLFMADYSHSVYGLCRIKFFEKVVMCSFGSCRNEVLINYVDVDSISD
jgi:hypothetical protein